MPYLASNNLFSFFLLVWPQNNVYCKNHIFSPKLNIFLQAKLAIYREVKHTCTILLLFCHCPSKSLAFWTWWSSKTYFFSKITFFILFLSLGLNTAILWKNLLYQKLFPLYGWWLVFSLKKYFRNSSSYKKMCRLSHIPLPSNTIFIFSRFTWDHS